MNLARDFILIARSQGQAPDPKITDGPKRITYEGQSTFMKFCTVCHEQMPHIRRDDYSECVVCGNRTYRGRQGPE